MLQIFGFRNRTKFSCYEGNFYFIANDIIFARDMARIFSKRHNLKKSNFFNRIEFGEDPDVILDVKLGYLNLERD